METFNWKQYLLNYHDLQKAGINDLDSAWNHYTRFGIRENRTDKKYDILITVITPCSRPENLKKIYESLKFARIAEWIIVYDREYGQFNFDNPRISEYYHQHPDSIVGNAQRNYGLSKVKFHETYIYFLDDDNIIHPELYRLSLLPNKFYSFNQVNGLLGKTIKPDYIDTAMVLIYYPLINQIQWKLDKYNADGIFIRECHIRNKQNWIYIDADLAYYNKLSDNKILGYRDLILKVHEKGNLNSKIHEKGNLNSKIQEKGNLIPRFIFKTSSFTDLPREILNAMEITKKLNPDHQLYYFNDSDIMEFLLDYDPTERILNAFKKLIPGAFKADLFRYCILEKYGGCYSDIGHIMEKSFDDICKNFDLVLVKEIKDFGIHNGLICSVPGHPLMKESIETCVYNIENEIYGSSDISVTGPKMLGTIFEKMNFEGNIGMLYHLIINKKKYIKDSENNTVVITKFENYDSIMYPNGVLDYHILWNNKKIFKL